MPRDNARRNLSQKRLRRGSGKTGDQGRDTGNQSRLQKLTARLRKMHGFSRRRSRACLSSARKRGKLGSTQREERAKVAILIIGGARGWLHRPLETSVRSLSFFWATSRQSLPGLTSSTPAAEKSAPCRWPGLARQAS